MSRVKNILVNDVEVFQEELIQELIKNQISYVQIENEFHFLDHIYRIYDLEIVAKLYLSFPKINFDGLINESSIDDNCRLLNMLRFTEVTDYVPLIEYKEKNDFCKDNHSTRINKQLIKQQNRQVNKIINKK